MLTLYTRAFTVVTALIFLTGMQIGFAHGPGRSFLRLLLLVSILASVGAAIVLAWQVSDQNTMCVVIGTALTTMGIMLFIASLLSHPSRPGKAFAIEPPSSLQCRGPYRVARHPLYLSYLLAFFGIATLTESWFVFAMSCWMVALYWNAAKMEERLILASDVGPAYTAYRHRVGMFWPWSLKSYRGHRRQER